MAFSSFVPNDSLHHWLTAALPLVVAPDETPVMRPIPVPMMAAAQSRKLKTTGGKTAAVNMTLKRRSSKNKAKAAASSPKVYKSN